MRVVVRYLRRVRPELLAWVASLPGAEPDRRALANQVLAAVTVHLRQFTDRVPDARAVPGIKPPAYWWRFHGGWWMQFRVVDERRWFRPTTRRIIVARVRPGPAPGPPDWR